MADHKTLAEALLALQADPPVLTKNRSGQVGNQKTRYADLVNVNTVVLSRLNGLGILWTCCPTMTADGSRFVLDYELRHVASGEAKSGQYPIKGTDNPQQQGSAITYARRYALLAITGIAAEDEDDDGQSANGRRTAQRSSRPAQDTGQATAQRAAGTGDITDPQSRKLHACLRDAGITERDQALAVIGEWVGRDIESTKDLSKREAAQVIDRLEKATGGQ